GLVRNEDVAALAADLRARKGRGRSRVARLDQTDGAHFGRRAVRRLLVAGRPGQRRKQQERQRRISREAARRSRSEGAVWCSRGPRSRMQTLVKIPAANLSRNALPPGDAPAARRFVSTHPRALS